MPLTYGGSYHAKARRAKKNKNDKIEGINSPILFFSRLRAAQDRPWPLEGIAGLRTGW